MAGGALVLAVGVLGAWAGWEASNDMAPQQPEQAMTLPLPPAKPLPAMTARSPAPAPSVAEVRPQAPARQSVADAAPVPAERALPRPLELTAAEEQQLAGNPFVESATAQIESAAAETAEDPAPVAAAPAAMPLPDRVIARTIQRIGYACGQVASTTAGGAPGVFKVTCTSGHSYRAQPIRGRYHFRRLGGQ